jgi:DNA polymerase I-like protein with 3'-5' exonuclease and polymerase domains
MRPDFGVVGFSVAVEGGPSLYVPVAHAGGQNVADREGAWRWLRDWARAFSGELVGLNLQYDLLALGTRDVAFPTARLLDVGVADALIDERHRSYSLEAVAERWGVPGKDEDALRNAAAAYGVDPKGGLWKLPAGHVARYATRDAEVPLEVLRKQEPRLKAEALVDVWRLEQRVTPAIVAMSQRGIRVDADRLEDVAEWVDNRIADRLARVQELTGILLAVEELDKKKALEPVFESAGIDMPRIEEGKRAGDIQVRKDYLTSLTHPAARALVEAREANTLRKTFVSGIRGAMANGRVHCTFRQLRGNRSRDDGRRAGTIARLSATHPNLQNQPRRHEGGEVFRRVFLPDEGRVLAEADYAAQEVRLMVHFALLAGCDGAEEVRDRFAAQPGYNLFRGIAQARGLDYQAVKNAMYAKSYGGGAKKVAATVGIPEDQVKWFLSEVYSAAPFLRQLQYRVSDAANDRGYVRTLLGRRLRFERLDPPVVNPWGKLMKHDRTHKGPSYLMQGSAADQTKLALAECHEASIPVQLQVHDSLVLSVESADDIGKVADIMRDCVALEVPVHVETKTGPSWGEMK